MKTNQKNTKTATVAGFVQTALPRTTATPASIQVFLNLSTIRGEVFQRPKRRLKMIQLKFDGAIRPHAEIPTAAICDSRLIPHVRGPNSLHSKTAPMNRPIRAVPQNNRIRKGSPWEYMSASSVIVNGGVRKMPSEAAGFRAVAEPFNNPLHSETLSMDDVLSARPQQDRSFERRFYCSLRSRRERLSCVPPEQTVDHVNPQPTSTHCQPNPKPHQGLRRGGSYRPEPPIAILIPESSFGPFQIGSPRGRLARLPLRAVFSRSLDVGRRGAPQATAEFDRIHPIHIRNGLFP